MNTSGPRAPGRTSRAPRPSLSLGSASDLASSLAAAAPDAVAGELAYAAAIATAAPDEIEQRNLFGEAQRIAARAASAGTRWEYAAIFRAFGDWLAGELGRPPLVGDVDTDAIAAYARHMATAASRRAPGGAGHHARCIYR